MQGVHFWYPTCMTQRIIRFLIQVELGIRWLVTSGGPVVSRIRAASIWIWKLLTLQHAGALQGVGGMAIGAFGALLILGYFTIDAKVQEVRQRRIAAFNEEVLESYKRTRGHGIDPAFCCHKRDY